MKVIPVPVRSDNYAYLIVDEATNKAAAVDVYDVPKVQAAAKQAGVEIVAGLTTHHHYDHSGGNEAFAAAFPGVPMYAGSNKAPAATNIVKDKDEFHITENIHVKCLHTPCHTQDSICYHTTPSSASSSTHPGGVFTGDTLFIAGCGRFFEGTSPEMHAALSYLSTLPGQTIVYNGHEYTKGNLAFAKSVEPENPAFEKLDKLVAEGETTGKSTIAEEREWNPFMRLDNPTIQKATGKSGDNQVMAELRELKNNFRG
ncbi:hydroxyacylglutathione hydrolase [Irpex rosettiformis]|uniref:Hydroxyacylglutathione hydrolase n=1 Tax=Irpex rosettiformis TaxID=378272 RepID=A0ACB8UIL0_9APHY|nr:hydroxyacylglutathione hydrolase [Irpex rosettiformis]